jgi:hypothetical protein
MVPTTPTHIRLFGDQRFDSDQLLDLFFLNISAGSFFV